MPTVARSLSGWFVDNITAWQCRVHVAEFSAFCQHTQFSCPTHPSYSRWVAHLPGISPQLQQRGMYSPVLVIVGGWMRLERSEAFHYWWEVRTYGWHLGWSYMYTINQFWAPRANAVPYLQKMWPLTLLSLEIGFWKNFQCWFSSTLTKMPASPRFVPDHGLICHVYLSVFFILWNLAQTTHGSPLKGFETIPFWKSVTLCHTHLAGSVATPPITAKITAITLDHKCHTFDISFLSSAARAGCMALELCKYSIAYF